MDLVKFIEGFDSEDFISLDFPRIEKGAEVDLSKYQKQESDHPDFKFEYVNQSCGIVGDDWSGTILFPLENDIFIAVDFNC